MAGFNRVRGGDAGFEEGVISSLALAVGDLLAIDRTNEVLIKATSSTSAEDIEGVVVAATTTANTTVLYQKIEDNDEFIVNMTNNTSASHNYHRMVLTDENEVNNTGTDSTSDAAVVMQIAPVGAASAKLARVRIVRTQDRA